MLLSRRCLLLALLLCGLSSSPNSQAASFDLAGPTLEVTVTRGKQALPITQVPNLQAGDRLKIRAELPPSQSAHYLMVAAFLRGPTNPPPADWFHRCDTWTHACQEGGLSLTVPADAQQLMLFFAPETGGDFKTLMNAVRGKPGAFVRASQELNQAALDRLRLERYLAGLRTLEQTDPLKVKEVAPLLARSLAIKVDEKCLDRVPALQASCLMEGRDALIMDDGHGSSMVATLTSGPASDLAMQAGSTPMFGGGFSPYIGPVLDIARLLDSFHTAKYQYIPALATQSGDRVTLMLNTPPSFHDPQSVLVAALPAVEPVQLPPLRPVDPKKLYCARQSPLLLPVDGAPLVFATGYAHDFVLRVNGPQAKDIDLPARPDPARGGYVVDTARLAPVALDERMHATLRGAWGFDHYDGPGFDLSNPPPRAWTLADGEEAALIVGREDTVRLKSGSVSCLDSLKLRDASGQETALSWKAIHDDEVELKLPLADARPGTLTLLVHQHGSAQPDSVVLNTYADAGHLEGFALHAGDASGVLRGTRLDQVAGLSFKGVQFALGDLTSAHGADELALAAVDPAAAATLKAGDTGRAKVSLKDGRSLSLEVVVAAPRPRATLIAKSIALAPPGAGAPIELGAADELPLDARLTFSIRAQAPAQFARDEEIEIATDDDAFSVRLGLKSGGLTLENSRVAVATLDPATAFGPSAFGALKFRRVVGGVTGEWVRLATLVRLPQLQGVRCASEPQDKCDLSGTNLFLIEAVAADSDFGSPVVVPDGFPGTTLSVPHPADGRLYLRLRDDPAAINVVSIATTP